MLRRLSSITAFILVCFFLSGLTGLIYEILWTRMLVKIIGGAPFAVSIVLTVFMAGLGIGSFLAGRLVDKIEKSASLIRLYGLLELTIALLAIIIPFAIGAFKPLYSFLYNRIFDHFLPFYFLTLVGCTIILIGPVICMGATLPVLCRFCARNISSIGANTGAVYGLNTMGAAAGALVCGFWLIGHLGTNSTLIIAVIVNCAIGLFCLALGFKVK
jgi:spermidine synthase